MREKLVQREMIRIQWRGREGRKKEIKEVKNGWRKWDKSNGTAVDKRERDIEGEREEMVGFFNW